MAKAKRGTYQVVDGFKMYFPTAREIVVARRYERLMLRSKNKYAVYAWSDAGGWADVAKERGCVRVNLRKRTERARTWTKQAA